MSILDLIRFGSEFEDRNRRPLNHFYDAQNDGEKMNLGEALLCRLVFRR